MFANTMLWFASRALLLIATVLLVMHYARPTPVPSPCSTTSSSPSPAVIQWLSRMEGQPLTCGQKASADDSSFRLLGLTEQRVLLQGTDLTGRPMSVIMARGDFDQMFGGIWITPLTPEQQRGTALLVGTIGSPVKETPREDEHPAPAASVSPAQ